MTVALASYSIKGGVGKTTAAINLADAAARSGARTLLWDLDPQGAASYLVRVRPRVKGGAELLVRKRGALAPHVRATDVLGLDIVPADLSLRSLDLYLDDTKRPTERLAGLLAPIADRYDVVLLDCPPGLTLTSEAVFGAVDALIVPTIPSTLSVRTLEQLEAFLATQHARPAVMPFASMVDRRKKIHRDAIADLVGRAPGFLRTAIPNASVVERMGVERAPIGAFAPTSAAATAFAALWAEIAGRLWP